MADTDSGPAPADDPKQDPIFNIEPPLTQAYYALRIFTLIDPADFERGGDDYEAAALMLGLAALENLIEAQKQFQAAIDHRRGTSGGMS